LALATQIGFLTLRMWAIRRLKSILDGGQFFQTSPYVLNFNFSLSLAKWKDLEITFPDKEARA